MNCPVCKCPNPAGATHCSMCYEVFNRSAEQVYLQAVRRERREKGEDYPLPDAEMKSQREITPKESILSKVDWQGLSTRFVVSTTTLARKYWKLAVFVLGLIGVWLVLGTLLS